MRTARERLAWGSGAVLLSAAALWHGTGLDPDWRVTWVAVLPVLAFALRASAPAAAVAAFSAWAGGAMNLWHYHRVVLGVPLPVAVVATAVPAIAFAALVIVMRVLTTRGRHLLAGLALPSGWTAFEHAVSRLSPHGTFGSLAYSQTDCLAVVQVASLVGISGITFLLLLVPSATAVLTLPSAARERRPLAWTTAALVALALAYGGWRLGGEPARASVTVGLVAADRPEQPTDPGTGEGQRLIAAYAREAAGLAARGAAIVVLPETVVRADDDELASLRSRFATATLGRVLVLGADRLAADGETNAAVAFVPGRAQPVVYSKQRLLLPFESRFRPGRERTLLATAWGTLGVAVCKDMDFPALGREYARGGASMLLVPAWDFTADGRLHSRMAVLRGVEGGFAVARAARGGRLTLSDDRGRVVAEAASAEAPVATLLAEVRVGGPPTAYARLGDVFAWLAVGLFALALVTGVRARGARGVGAP